MKVTGKGLGVNGRRSYNEFEIFSFGDKRMEVPQQKINIEISLVGLVDNHNPIFSEQRIVFELCQEHPVGHELDSGGSCGSVPKPDLAAHQFSIFSKLFRDPLGNTGGRNPAGLGTAYPAFRVMEQFKAQFRQLGGLTGSGFTGYDDYLMGRNQFSQLLETVGDRQRRRVKKVHEKVV
jgi:hypothetical protein